jgi:hypothetical protein
MQSQRYSYQQKRKREIVKSLQARVSRGITKVDAVPIHFRISTKNQIGTHKTSPPSLPPNARHRCWQLARYQYVDCRQALAGTAHYILQLAANAPLKDEGAEFKLQLICSLSLAS